MGGKQRYGSYAVCRHCESWRYHARFNSNQCICGKPWPKEETVKARAVQAKAAATKATPAPTTSQSRLRIVTLDLPDDDDSPPQMSPKQTFELWKAQGIIAADMPEPAWVTISTPVSKHNEAQPPDPITAKQCMQKAQKAFNAACHESTRKLQAMEKTARRVSKCENDLQKLRAQHIEERRAYEESAVAVQATHAAFDKARAEDAAEEAKLASECEPKPVDGSKCESEHGDAEGSKRDEPGNKRRKKESTEAASPEEEAFWDSVKAKFMSVVDPGGPNSYGGQVNDWGQELVTGLHEILAKKIQKAPNDADMPDADPPAGAAAPADATAAAPVSEPPRPEVPLFNQVEGDLSEAAALAQRDAALAGLAATETGRG